MQFPVLAFNQGKVKLVDDFVSLTTCSPFALKKGGWYEDLFVVDSNGHGYRVRDARKLHGGGSLASPSVRVELDIATEMTVALDEVKQLLRGAIGSWHDWAPGCAGDLLRATVESAPSPAAIIAALGNPVLNAQRR